MMGKVCGLALVALGVLGLGGCEVGVYGEGHHHARYREEVVVEPRPMPPQRVVVVQAPPPPRVVYVQPAPPPPQPVVVAEAPQPLAGVVVVQAAPPAPLVEVVPGRPGPDFMWVKGYWVVDHNRWVWVQGGWRRPPHAGAVWVEPRWDRHGNEYHYAHGEWR